MSACSKPVGRTDQIMTRIYLQAELFVVSFFISVFLAAFKNKVLHIIRQLQGFHLLMRIADICFVSFNLVK